MYLGRLQPVQLDASGARIDLHHNVTGTSVEHPLFGAHQLPRPVTDCTTSPRVTGIVAGFWAAGVSSSRTKEGLAGGHAAVDKGRWAAA
jgi:hypothetical protein